MKRRSTNVILRLPSIAKKTCNTSYHAKGCCIFSDRIMISVWYMSHLYEFNDCCTHMICVHALINVPMNVRVQIDQTSDMLPVESLL